MKLQKTWLTANLTHNNVSVEISLNYETKNFNVSEPHEDQRVTFSSDDSIEDCSDRIKCVASALKFIKQELEG